MLCSSLEGNILNLLALKNTDQYNNIGPQSIEFKRIFFVFFPQWAAHLSLARIIMMIVMVDAFKKRACDDFGVIMRGG